MKITDPQQIVQKILQNYNKNGWIVSKSVERDLNIILSVSDADVTYFDWIGRELEVFNYTLRHPNINDAVLLKVGHFHVKWDSYLQPSFQIKVENIDIILAFTNIFLTETNWKELNEMGFPPKILWDDTQSSDVGKNTESQSTSFVRIGSIDLSGNVTLKIRSRPLEKDIVPQLILDLGMLDDWNQRIIQSASKSKRGCSTDEIFTLMVEFVQEKVDQLLEDVALDLFTNFILEDDIRKSRIVQHGKKLVQGLQDSAEQYMKDLAERTGTKIGQRIADKLNTWGFL